MKVFAHFQIPKYGTIHCWQTCPTKILTVAFEAEIKASMSQHKKKT